MPRKTADSSNRSKKFPVAPETNAAVLRALDNLDAAVSKLSDVVSKIICQPCDIQQVKTAEHLATLVPSEVLPPMPMLEVPPLTPIAELTDSQQTTETSSAEAISGTQTEPQHGFAERLLSARHRTQQ